MENNEVKIIAKAPYWRCSNMDLLAPIEENGICYLLSNNEIICVESGKKALKFEYASEEERIEFARQYRHYVFAGDKVNIIKGKMKGESKVVSRHFRYVVPNTYGKNYTDYIVFEDGSKTNIWNCVHESGVQIWGYREADSVDWGIGGRI